MKMTKKVLGVVLALAMLVNVFAMFSFAAAPDSAVDLGLSVDKTSYAPGDIVTITFSMKVEPEVGDMRIGGGYAIGYSSSVLEPLSDSMDLTAHNFAAIQPGVDVPNSFINFTQECFDGGDTIDEGNGWDSIFFVGVTDDNGATTFSATEGVDLFTVQMKIADNAAPGEYVVGYNIGSYDNYHGIVTDVTMGGVAGTEEHYYTTTNDYGFGTVTIKVGGDVEESILQYSKAQIRFAGIGATSTAADYKGTFDVRTIAKISQADFLAKFESEENAIAKISDIGFVYATTSNVAVFDADTAKAVAEGGSAANYVKAPVTRIQHTADNADYIFTCLIENIADADKTDGVGCLAYVCFDGEYIYFDAPVTVSYNTLYTTYMPA